MKKYNVAIVDDHKLFAAALSDLVGNMEQFNVFASYKNGEDMKNKLRHNTKLPDLVLMDVNMPIMDGEESALWLKSTFPNIKVLALSMNNDEIDIIKMLKAGAKGYVLKDVSPEELRLAMIAVLEAGYYNNELSSNAMDSIIHGKTNNVQLKEREIEFLKLACSEKTYKEIASDMHLSPKTIDGYREGLFHKLDVKNRIGLVLYCIKNKIIKV